MSAVWYPTEAVAPQPYVVPRPIATVAPSRRKRANAAVAVATVNPQKSKKRKVDVYTQIYRAIFSSFKNPYILLAFAIVVIASFTHADDGVGSFIHSLGRGFKNATAGTSFEQFGNSLSDFIDNYSEKIIACGMFFVVLWKKRNLHMLFFIAIAFIILLPEFSLGQYSVVAFATYLFFTLPDGPLKLAVCAIAGIAFFFNYIRPPPAAA